jgi:hypothetical protein
VPPHHRPSHPAAPDLRRADAVARRRFARQLLDAQADMLGRTYLTPAEVAGVLADLAEQWGRDAVARLADGVGLDPAASA